MRFEAVIKVCIDDPLEKRAHEIGEGIGYACALLADEYGWPEDKITDLLERVTDDVVDNFERREQL